MNKFQILLFISSFLISSTIQKNKSYEREQIDTIDSGVLAMRITTGSGNSYKLNFKDLFDPIDSDQSHHKIDVPKETRKLVTYYKNIKNMLIADLANQDPKVFRPKDERYWKIANRRGFFFNLLSIICKSLIFFNNLRFIAFYFCIFCEIDLGRLWWV